MYSAPSIGRFLSDPGTGFLVTLILRGSNRGVSECLNTDVSFFLTTTSAVLLLFSRYPFGATVSFA